MAQLIAPNQSLKQKVGNSSAADDLRSLDELNGALHQLSPQFTNVIVGQITELGNISAPFNEQSMRQIYEVSHSLRGIAGSFSSFSVSNLADSLCRYIDGVDKNDQLDDRLVQAHINSLPMFVNQDGYKQEAVDTILLALREAVTQKIGSSKMRAIETLQ